MIDQAAAFGVDIGRNSIRIAVVRMQGKILDSVIVPLKTGQTKEELVSLLISSLKDLRLKIAGQGINPICIGVSAKGFIDHKKGIVVGPDQGIKGWMNVPLASMINEETGLPAFVENDANLMTIAEQRFGAAKGYNDVVFVALRSGIGGGLIINGKLYRGLNNGAGEIGQMIINYDNGISDLGIKGSFEHLASASAVTRRYYEETVKTGRPVNLSCREIFELSYQGIEPALKIITENAEIVGIGLANMISIFSPEIIIVGGGMSGAHESYLEQIRRSALSNSLENCRKGVKIERAVLGPDASVMGSAYFALMRLAGKLI